jgi:hypothetical protein
MADPAIRVVVLVADQCPYVGPIASRASLNWWFKLPFGEWFSAHCRSLVGGIPRPTRPGRLSAVHIASTGVSIGLSLCNRPVSLCFGVE